MTPLDGSAESAAPAEIPKTDSTHTPNLAELIERYTHDPTPAGMYPNEITVDPGFWARNRTELRALGAGVLTLFGAATAIELSQDPVSLPQSVESHAKPAITAPSPGYMERAPQFVIPTSTPPELQSLANRLLARATDVPQVEVEESTASDDAPEELPATATDTSSTPRATSTARIDSATQTASIPTADATSAPTEATQTQGTATARPTSTPRERTASPTETNEAPEDASIVEEFTEKTGIDLRRVGDLPHASDLREFYDLSPSETDAHLEQIVASTILGLPEDVRQSLRSFIKHIYVGRAHPENYIVEEGDLMVVFGESTALGVENMGNSYLIDVPNGLNYDSTSTTVDTLKSGLAADVEARMVLIGEIWGLHYTDPDSKPSMTEFFEDNQAINYSHPQIEEFLDALYYGEGSTDIFLPHLVGRIIALRATGQDDRVARAVATGVIDMSRFPVFEE